MPMIVCEVQISSRRGALFVSICALRSQTGKFCHATVDSTKQVAGIGGAGAYQARPCRLAAGQAGIGAQPGRPRLVWGGRRAPKWPHCCEAPGPAVLGGPPQAKAPPAHSLMPCVWGVGMSLLCPPGGPTGAHSLIYQANPIGRPARKATADFSKITIIFLGSPCTIFPKVSQTANKSA